MFKIISIALSLSILFNINTDAMMIRAPRCAPKMPAASRFAMQAHCTRPPLRHYSQQSKDTPDWALKLIKEHKIPCAYPPINMRLWELEKKMYYELEAIRHIYDEYYGLDADLHLPVNGIPYNEKHDIMKTLEDITFKLKRNLRIINKCDLDDEQTVLAAVAAAKNRLQNALPNDKNQQ